MKKFAFVVIIWCFYAPLAAAEKNPPASERSAFFKSYITAVKNSAGMRIFRRLYLYDKDAGRIVEVLQDGNLACAYFVSSVLRHFGLLDGFYLGVTETADAMKKNGWKIIERPVIGSVIVWDKKYSRRSEKWHGHIGFYIGRGRAVSTSSWRGCPIVHSIKSWRRKITEILWHEKLEQPLEGGA